MPSETDITCVPNADDIGMEGHGNEEHALPCYVRERVNPLKNLVIADVFISFRGGHTLRSLVASLGDAFYQQQIQACKYVTTGEKIGSKLIPTIQRPHLCLTIFSENYASPIWSSDEIYSVLEDYKLELKMKMKQTTSLGGHDPESEDYGSLNHEDGGEGISRIIPEDELIEEVHPQGGLGGKERGAPIAHLNPLDLRALCNSPSDLFPMLTDNLQSSMTTQIRVPDAVLELLFQPSERLQVVKEPPSLLRTLDGRPEVVIAEFVCQKIVIEEPPILFLIYSKGYFRSTWCLEELVMIIDCYEQVDRNQMDLPVFYVVDPSEVRKQTGSYRLAFALHEEIFTNSEKVQRWREASSKMANPFCCNARNKTMFNETERSGARAFSLPRTVFIFSKITAYVRCPLKLAPFTQHPIVTDNLQSSMKTEIGVFDDELGSNGIEDWMLKSIDNRSIQRKLRLSYAGLESHERLSLDDLVWHLKMITKHGKVHLLLSSGIKTNQDLLLLWKSNASLPGQGVILFGETNKNPPQVANGVPQLYEKEHSRSHKIDVGKPDEPATLNQRKRREKMARFSSSLVTLTFPLLLFSTMFMNPLNRTHGSKSILLAFLAMFNFMLFASAVSVMITVGAQFSRIQVILLTMSAVAMHVASPSLLFMLMEVPILIILMEKSK